MSASEKVPLTQEKDGPQSYSGINKGPTVVFAPQPPVFIDLGGPPPDDYLVMSILTILFCFWPLGIVALIKSIEVRNAITKGDLGAAERASKSAFKYNKLSIIIGIASAVFWFVIIVLCQLAWIIPSAINPNPGPPHVNETMLAL